MKRDPYLCVMATVGGHRASSVPHMTRWDVVAPVADKRRLYGDGL
ncbi:MAG TPA: hypothetical protein VL485_23330 [Ktedonobacteraceae bacterium]|nr:hypothetical protein [Ktedonobacteraceae bacterium]